DSSKMAWTSILLSYVPPLRVICAFRKKSPIPSTIFHPSSLKLWEIPITQEYTWYNLKYEVRLFKSFLKSTISEIKAGCLVINSHVDALSTWGLQILRELFLCIKELGINKLTLQEMADRSTGMETTKVNYA
ncbi:MAG: hypothetical protein JSW53_01995, partial [Candidatus Bathyarchaeota archaeon]